MIDTPNAGIDFTRISTLLGAAWAVYADWVVNNGAVVLTTIGILYGVFQFWARRREHKAFMRKVAREEADEQARK